MDRHRRVRRDAIGIWDAESGELEFSVSGHTAPVNRLDWSPDSTRLAIDER